MHSTTTLKGIIVIITTIIQFMLINMLIQQSSCQRKAQNKPEIMKKTQWTHKITKL